MRLEFDVSLSALLGDEYGVLLGLPLLGSGAAWAFGRVGLRFGDGNVDVTDSIRKSAPEIYESVHVPLEWAMLRGPQDHQVDEQRARGWVADAGTAVAERRAQQKREQAARFNSDAAWRSRPYPRHHLGS